MGSISLLYPGSQFRTACIARLYALLLLLPLPAVVQAQFDYTTNNGTITITKYTGPGGDVVIPHETNGLPVTSIGQNAFYNSTAMTSVMIPYSITNIGSNPFGYCTSLTAIMVDESNSVFSSVSGILFDKSQTILMNYPGGKAGAYTIPGGVTSIGGFAFAWCYGLTEITIPNGVTSIGTQAFWNDNSLSTVTIPASVTNIASLAFTACSSMQTIKVDQASAFYCDVGGVLFDVNKTTLMQYPAGATNVSYAIPESVTAIAASAFSASSKLTSVTIPDSVTSMGSAAFSGSGLTSITIPNSITSIPGSGFQSCRNLTNVIVGAGVTNVGNLCFSSCSSLGAVHFSSRAPGVGSTPFLQANKATVYYLPGTIGWSTTFGGRPTAQWWLPYPLVLSSPNFGVQTNVFGFVVSWATNVPVVVEGCVDLAQAMWAPISTNSLTNGWFYFSDPAWANYPARLYRVRSP